MGGTGSRVNTGNAALAEIKVSPPAQANRSIRATRFGSLLRTRWVETKGSAGVGLFCIIVIGNEGLRNELQGITPRRRKRRPAGLMGMVALTVCTPAWVERMTSLKSALVQEPGASVSLHSTIKVTSAIAASLRG